MDAKSTSEAVQRNSFAEYAVLKSSSSSTTLNRLPDDALFDIPAQPASSTSPSFLLPPQSNPPSAGLSPVGSPRSTSSFLPEMSSHRDLVAAARREHDHCGTAEEKESFKKKWVPFLLNRLRELSEMEAKSTVGVEIADTVELLKTMYSSETVCKEIGEISDKSRQGVIKLQEGLLLVDKAKEQIRSALNKKLFSAE
ncbi:hypothetical protein LINPERPRIM_LOCUS7687 [Linum perenne]